jgi:hypothetical protein
MNQLPSTVARETQSATKDPVRSPDPLFEGDEAWPVLQEAAFQGIAGAFVRMIEPHTEADPVGILIQLLAAFGNAAGRASRFRVEADDHHTNLFVALVGKTANGRKGTSWGQVRNFVAPIDPNWEPRIVSGLSSGEGLVWHVRDPAEDEDEGVSDKRLFVVEPELASVLRVAKRDGNTLSALIREGWDRGDLQTLTKNSPARATGAHLSIVGHITRDELLRHLDATEVANGFANRFLWICVRRSKHLPEGGSLADEALFSLNSQFRQALIHARQPLLLTRSQPARELWRAKYAELESDRYGLWGSVTARAAAQVTRLSVLYALLDEAKVVDVEHLEAGLALWQYAEDSARYVFGDATGNPAADTILRALRQRPGGATRSEISRFFSNHTSAAAIEAALETLRAARLVIASETPTGGRPVQRWRAARCEGAKKAKERGGTL